MQKELQMSAGGGVLNGSSLSLTSLLHVLQYKFIHSRSFQLQQKTLLSNMKRGYILPLTFSD